MKSDKKVMTFFILEFNLDTSMMFWCSFFIDEIYVFKTSSKCNRFVDWTNRSDFSNRITREIQYNSQAVNSTYL